MPTSVVGADKIISDINKILQALSPGNIGSIMNEGGREGESEAKSRARVRTGRMRDSTKWQQQGPYSGTLGSDVDYAAANELGTSRMSAQPFITPGATVAVQAITKALADLLKL